jgi:putative endonuclease
VGSRHLELGRLGEDRAAAWYAKQGYRVLQRNWRCGSGEIDLICARAGVLVVCEVKARRSAAHGQPFEAVTPDKQRRLRRLAAEYLVTLDRERSRDRSEHRGEHPFYEDIRFDVVSVLGSLLEVIEGAF